ncbi:YgjP-like metallopeptidase domain-containing protein [Natronococcus occultus]|uniref:Putative metal-dependent hydrolase n=1 Tax=Natronococcus occultus SP4 TaxID=694430 RepID=L0K0G0_9EURY|nr:YgjP-like metallopeptidase domain-containing protein [Natronococcus occultus]AGB38045.1 putative metal-dependent hydrolase [Natronococcus occultus SP4]
MSDVDPRLRVFVDLFNLAYPDWNPPTGSNLKPEHVDFHDNLTSVNGSLGVTSNGEVIYRVNTGKWRSWDVNRRLKLVIHELGHVKHQNHSPDFWNRVVEIYHTFHEHKDEVDDIIAGDIDWSEVREHLVNNPTNRMVDNRVETAYERQLKLADELGYPEDDIPPFDEMEILRVRRDSPDETFVEPKNLVWERHDIDDLVTYFRSPNREGIRYNNGSYRVDPPKGVEVEPGHIQVVEGHKRAEILFHTHLKQSFRSRVLVRLVDDEDVGGDAAVADD